MRKKFISTAALGLVLLLGVTGCAGNQPVAEACDTVQENLDSLSTDLQGSMEGLASGNEADADAAVEAFSTLEDGLEAATEKIDNAQAEEAMENLGDKVEALGDVMEDAADNATDTQKMQELTDAFKSAAEDVQSATTKLQELCS